MPRPLRVEIAAYLMAASIVMSLAVAWTTTPPPGLLISTYAGFGATIVGLIEGAVVLAFWNRMEWSRTAVVVFSVLWLTTVIWAGYRLVATHSLGSVLADDWELDPSFMLLVAAKILLFIYLLISLNTRIARGWFTRRANFKSQQT